MKMMIIILLIYLMAGMAAFAGNTFIYADGHKFTSGNQPPRYYVAGNTSKPLKGTHPEYALGAPDSLLTGWGPENGSLILHFPCKNGLRNIDGNDLFVWHSGRKKPEVYVSTDRKSPVNWHLVGALSDTGHHESPVVKDSFDFGDLDGIFYVKIKKTASGFWTGHFIDAVSGLQCVSISDTIEH